MNSTKYYIILGFTWFLLLSCVPEDRSSVKTEALVAKEQGTTSDMTGMDQLQKPAAFAEAFKVVDELPLFGGCATVECSNQKLIAYIQEHLKYPEEARIQKLEGKVFIQFIVEKDGSVSNTYIAKDIGGGCGQAAVAIVEEMNNLATKWTPGRNKGKPVNVAFTLPFSYKLE